MCVDLHVYNLSLLSWTVHCWNLDKKWQILLSICLCILDFMCLKYLEVFFVVLMLIISCFLLTINVRKQIVALVSYAHYFI
jgi:endonuclease/exonuclease/phosphatase (EEP) superfamily protein YafD